MTAGLFWVHSVYRPKLAHLVELDPDDPLRAGGKRTGETLCGQLRYLTRSDRAAGLRICDRCAAAGRGDS